MPGIQSMLERVAQEKGIKFEEFVEKLKHKNQWCVRCVWGAFFCV